MRGIGGIHAFIDFRFISLLWRGYGSLLHSSLLLPAGGLCIVVLFENMTFKFAFFQGISSGFFVRVLSQNLFIPRVCAGFGIFPWFRVISVKFRSRTNESRAHAYVSFPRQR